MTTATISVVVPLFNQAQWVPAAVESALHQTFAPTEVIVVDDGSTDGGAAGLEALGEQVRVIRQANAGVARARNAGAASATGSHVAFLDSDDVWRPTKLELQMKALRELRGSCIAHCGLEVIGDQGQVLRTRLDGATGLVAEGLFLLKESLVGSSSTALVPREVFQHLGGFDPQLSYSADWDLNLRLAELGPVAFVPQPLVVYRYHEAGMHRNIDLMCADMLAASANAVIRDPARYTGLSKQSLAKIHLVMSGSYLHARQPVRAVSHLARALAIEPALARYALGIVGRKMRRPPFTT